MKKSVIGAAVALMVSGQAMAWAPTDPYYKPLPVSSTPSTAVPERQWGLSAMEFDWAWNTTRGNAYIGLVDGGLPGNITLLSRQSPNEFLTSFTPHEDLKNNLRTHFLNTPVFKQIDNTSNLALDFSWHATHVAGIIAAEANNKGIVGGCPTCSLITIPPAPSSGNGIKGGGLTMGSRDDVAVDQLNRAIRLGSQVINWSGEFKTNSQGDRDSLTCDTGTNRVYQSCDVIQLLKSRDVLLVQSAGNTPNQNPAFPGRLSDQSVPTLAVAGTGAYYPGFRMGTMNPQSLWKNLNGDPTNGSSFAGIYGVLAPADRIVSTTPLYQYGQEYMGVNQCGDYASDASAAGNPSRIGDGYGTCSGTSMAAPHVSALAGLLRSVNPLLPAVEIRSIIQKSGNLANDRTAELGYGLPSAGKAMVAVTATNPKRLTPLFSFYSSSRMDSFYTTVPQMAVAALAGELEPRKQCNAEAYDVDCERDNPRPTYTSEFGQPINNWGDSRGGYFNFPGRPSDSVNRPLAEVWVFTTPQNPKSASIPLVPLNRMSWKCAETDTNIPACASTNFNHTDTTYTTDQDGINAFESVGYKVDGIEGYIYPKTIPQPVGTVRLMRKYNPARDDHAIFPESRSAYMMSIGYTDNSGSDWLGYVYPNTGDVPAIQ